MIVHTRQRAASHGLLLAVLAVAACSPGGRDAKALAETELGRFTAPPGSSLVKESYEPQSTSGVFTNCASYTRIFGTNDASAFQAAVYSTALAAGWSSDQSEATSPSPIDGMTAVFRGQREVAQLGFWSSAEKTRNVSAMQDVRFDWNSYQLAAAIEVFDGSYTTCFMSIASGMTRVSGRVTDSASAVPLADVGVTAHHIVGGACPGCTALANGQYYTAVFRSRTDADGRYSFEWLRSWQSPIRISFGGGLGYRIAWWRDASSIETAADVVVSGAQRNMAIEGIDARMESPSIPSGAVINIAQRYGLAGATTLTIAPCPAASPPLATGCLNATTAVKRDAALVGPFARALDAELARVRPEAPASNYVLIAFAFGTPPPPGEFRLIAGTFVAFIYDEARALLTVSTPRDDIAVRAPEAFVQLVASSR